MELDVTAPDFGREAGELSWGPGLTPSGLQDAPLGEGGIYRGKAPAVPDGDGLRALADELAARRGDR
ncbi:hypothetical protein GCM10007298_06270 [Williamsia phyllosphaerae]|uniref:Uncharacterized protein n=1 Tax=Williamsia phyllosphaerae TaxID=885042 RepID=A0ABQ1UAC9_9NOCA|nr:hypothetical protein GCM10007298_06270 [Williamsia phyllosphaerae]